MPFKPTSSAPFEKTRKRPLIVVVDDDASSREVLAAILCKLGYLCELYDSVRTFIQSQALHRADCIILDYAMPEIDGLVAQKCISKTNYAGPIIFCSGYAESEIRSAAEAHGAAFFLRKPFTKQQLVKALQLAGIPAPQ